MVPSSWLPSLIVTHVTLALALFLPAFLLPFTMRTRTRDGEPVPGAGGRFVRLLLWIERNAMLVIGVGVAITGVLMLTVLGAGFAQQVWLQIALAIYAMVLLISFFIQRPELRRMLGIRTDASPEEQAKWRTRARRQRYMSYGMAGAIGLIGWLMMAKPGV